MNYTHAPYHGACSFTVVQTLYWATVVAQIVKNMPAMQETGV